MKLSKFFAEILRLEEHWISYPSLFHSIMIEGKKTFSKKAMTDNIWLKLTEKVYSNKLTVRVK